MAVDIHDLTGKIPPPDERFATVVVGAGDAGTAAALAAVADGPVLLIDENPVSAGLMGTDVPLFYGGRMTGAVQNGGRMIETMLLARPALEAAFDAGIDVRLGTAAWGLYRNGPAIETLPAPMLGLADATRAYMVGFDRLILATGARDLVLGFPGWDRPGVMGAQGFHALVAGYDAFAGRRVLILGSDALALRTALLAVARGIDVAGLVEIADAPQGPADLVQAVRDTGVEIFTATTIAATSAGIDGIASATLRMRGNRVPLIVPCDTIVLAVATVPATELVAASGCHDDVVLVGDCAGEPPAPALVTAWAEALGRFAADDTIVCQCEEVTRADLIGVQPPRYLDRPARMAARSLATLANDGPAHPDQIKRLTRAGMGACQGRRCREQVACLLAAATGTPVEHVPVASLRAPVRPVPLKLLADWHERADMAAGWDVWFGIPTQWIPYAAIGTPREAELLADAGNMHV